MQRHVDLSSAVEQMLHHIKEREGLETYSDAIRVAIAKTAARYGFIKSNAEPAMLKGRGGRPRGEDTNSRSARIRRDPELGIAPDAELAERYGISTQLVGRARRDVRDAAGKAAERAAR